MFKFAKRFKSLLMSAGAAAMATAWLTFASPAYANTPDMPRATDFQQDAEDASSDPMFRQGVWRRVTENDMGNPDALSLEALTRAEREASRALGRPIVFFKVIMPDGVYTNLQDSQIRGPETNRTYMFSRGLLEPVDGRRNLNEMGDYRFRVTKDDRALVPYIIGAHRTVVAMASTPEYRLAMAGITREELPAARVRPRARPVEVARVELPVNPPLPVARPAQEEIDRILNPAPVQVAAVEEIAPVVVGGGIERSEITVAALEPIPQLTAGIVLDPGVPVRRVRTERIVRPVARPVTQVASVQNRRPVVTETAPVVVATAPVEQTVQTPVVVAEASAPAPVLVAANDAAVQRVSLTNVFQRASRNSDLLVAANDTRPSLRAVPPAPANRDEQTADKFNRYAIFERAEFAQVKDNGPVAANDWVTPNGRNVEFEVYANGRFRVAAPALRMAA